MLDNQPGTDNPQTTRLLYQRHHNYRFRFFNLSKIILFVIIHEKLKKKKNTVPPNILVPWWVIISSPLNRRALYQYYMQEEIQLFEERITS